MLSHLLLMRHAKSSWSDRTLSDHERPLNTRGEKSAPAIGAALHARGYAPDIIWSSDSKRTRQTSMLLIREIPGAQTVQYNPNFYHASAELVVNICSGEAEPDGKLMLLGHNPGWAELHTYFTGQYHNFPTGACTVLARQETKGNCDANWMSPTNWKMIDLLLPRELLA